MLSYDTDTQLVIVIDGEDALLVDVSLCVDPWTGPWIRERLCKVMTLGHLESADVSIFPSEGVATHLVDFSALKDQLAIPTLPNFAPAPSVDPHLVLRAILITPVPDLDLNLWNASIKEMEASIDSDEMLSPFPSSQVHIE